MSSKKLFSLIGIILLSLFCLIYLQQNINKIREKNFIGTNITLTDVPPVVSFTTIALGGFRGIVADILWLKAISLQDEGKYFEMIQLASWILKLQPKSTGAIAFLAWNMAYNISIIYTEPGKKWQWVKNGVNLLRDALQYNPVNASLCKELAWIYINKIGNKYDSSNLYYKTQLALDMEKIISNDPQEDQNFWNLMAKTPSNYKEFIKKELSGECISEILRNSEYKDIEDLYIFFKNEGRLPQQVEFKLADSKSLQSLILFLKKKMLKEEFGLEPEKIVEINEKFGKLDWRLYSSLAIYWGYVGISVLKDSRECRSALNMALAAAVLNGKLLLVDHFEYNDFTTCLNFSVFPIINNYFMDKVIDENNADYTNFYFSFANKIIPELYLYGRYEEAKAIFDNIKKACPGMSSFTTLDVFLNSYWNSYFEQNNKEQILSNIIQYIRISYLLNRKGMPDVAESLKNNSQYIYDRYSKNYFNNKLPEFRSFYTDKINALQKNIK